MTTHTAPSRTLPFELGEPRSFSGLTVFPLFPSEPPALDYVGLDEAAAQGLAVTEVDEAGSVPFLQPRQPAEASRPPVRGRGARRRQAEPHPREDDPRRGRRQAEDPGRLRRGRPLVVPLAPLRARAARGLPGAPPPQARRLRRARPGRGLEQRRGQVRADGLVLPDRRPGGDVRRPRRRPGRVRPGAAAARRPVRRADRDRRRGRLPRLRRPLGRLRRPLPQAPPRLRAGRRRAPGRAAGREGRRQRLSHRGCEGASEGEPRGRPRSRDAFRRWLRARATTASASP